VNLYKSDNSEFKFLIVPEIMVIPQLRNSDFGSPVSATLGVSMNFNIKKLLKL